MKRSMKCLIFAVCCVMMAGCARESAEDIKPETSAELIMDENVSTGEFTDMPELDVWRIKVHTTPSRADNIRIDPVGIDMSDVKEDEDLSKEVQQYIEDRLGNADEICLEWKNGQMELDGTTYQAWFWIDGSLLQEELVRLGYAVGDGEANKYTTELYNAEQAAKLDHAGIWAE